MNTLRSQGFHENEMRSATRCETVNAPINLAGNRSKMAQNLRALLSALETHDVTTLSAFASSGHVDTSLNVGPVTAEQKHTPVHASTFTKVHDSAVGLFVGICGEFVVTRRLSDGEPLRLQANVMECATALGKGVGGSLVDVVHVMKQFVSAPLFPALPFPDTISMTLERYIGLAEEGRGGRGSSVETVLSACSQLLAAISNTVTSSFRTCCSVTGVESHVSAIVTLAHLVAYCGLAR